MVICPNCGSVDVRCHKKHCACQNCGHLGTKDKFQPRPTDPDMIGTTADTEIGKISRAKKPVFLDQDDEDSYD